MATTVSPKGSDKKQRLCIMIKTIVSWMDKITPAPQVHAHCDGPCGIYDPAQARVTAEAAVSMTKKILELESPKGDCGSPESIAHCNTFTRFVKIKEEQAHETKQHLLVLWTDYFKPEHLKKYPNLHETFWKAAKLCSAVKVEVNLEKANELLKTIEEIHQIFWATKERDVDFVKAAG